MDNLLLEVETSLGIFEENMRSLIEEFGELSATLQKNSSEQKQALLNANGN